MSLRLVPIVDGNEAGETLVFVQGWPDDASLWDDAVAALAAKYRCVRVTLPNFGGDRTARWGYTTDEIVDALGELLRTAGRGKPVTLVLHDWGCYWGHPAHHRCPELVSRVVGITIRGCARSSASSFISAGFFSRSSSQDQSAAG
jgi:cis-3-alkyl-4-acyloxetan-2-one decarboxylase